MYARDNIAWGDCMQSARYALNLFGRYARYRSRQPKQAICKLHDEDARTKASRIYCRIPKGIESDRFDLRTPGPLANETRTPKPPAGSRSVRRAVRSAARHVLPGLVLVVAHVARQAEHPLAQDIAHDLRGAPLD
jgi:hypothetical protein